MGATHTFLTPLTGPSQVSHLPSGLSDTLARCAPPNRAVRGIKGDGCWADAAFASASQASNPIDSLILPICTPHAQAKIEDYICNYRLRL